MKKTISVIFISLILIFVIFYVQQKPQEANTYTVVRVVDGDTFSVMMNGKAEKVRLIGVDTPESVKPNTPVQAFAKEASIYTKSLIEGKNVKLELDVSERDNYGRILAYVYLADGRMLNNVLVQEGYAKVMTVPPNVKYSKTFIQSERSAREQNKGLWKK